MDSLNSEQHFISISSKAESLLLTSVVVGYLV